MAKQKKDESVVATVVASGLAARETAAVSEGQKEQTDRGAVDNTAAAEWAKTRESLKAQFAVSVMGTLNGLTAGMLAAGAIGWRFVHGCIMAHGTAAAKEHGRTWTNSVKELASHLEATYGERDFNVSLLLGAYALRRITGEWLDKLPWSLVRELVPLVQRDDTFPGLERMTDASAPAYELAYAFPDEIKKQAESLLAGLADKVKSGAKLPTVMELAKSRQNVTGTKARGRGKKKHKAGGQVVETGPVADAVRRFKLALSGKGLKDIPDARRTVVKKAIAEKILTASDLSSAILAIGEDDTRSPREKLGDLRQVKGALIDTMKGLERQRDAVAAK